jgi:paraquat-inducible protein A
MLPPVRELMVCRHCDALHRRGALGKHDVARCIACGGVLARTSSLNVDHALAITLTAAVVFLIASANPLLVVGIGGMHSEATVWSAALGLMHGWMGSAGAALAVTTFLLPLVQIALLLWLLGFAWLGRRAPGSRRLLIALHLVRPWSMTEVFLLGTLVAIVKLSSWVPVRPGIGVWALASLTVLLTLINMIEPRHWWKLCLPP